MGAHKRWAFAGPKGDLQIPRHSLIAAGDGNRPATGSKLTFWESQTGLENTGTTGLNHGPLVLPKQEE